ncbi:hypothetical protein G6F43_012708 [Rhizopus delemar]|nr:hypothetical protein G6F43_012708 [Rhizopus delemar]
MANLTVSPSDSIRAANSNDVPSVFQLPQYQPRAARVNDPPIYDGTPGTLANFITHVKMCINVDRSRFANEISKICFLCSFMSGHAFSWAQPFLDALDTDQPLPACMQSLSTFIDALREAFGEVNAQLHVETSLLNLRQGKGSTAEYAATFRRLASQTRYNEPALLGIFRHSLSDDVKDALATRIVPSDLWPFVTCCIELDNLIRDRAQQRKLSNNSHSRHSGSTNRSRFIPPPAFTKPMQPSTPDSVEPMDLDVSFTRKFKPLTTKEKQRRRNLGLCMYCGDDGHAAPNCPKKSGKGPTQASILTTAMIDSGAMSNFIDSNFVKHHDIPLYPREIPAIVQNVDGSSISSGVVTHESRLSLTTGNHSEHIVLDSVSLGHYPVILGISWLTIHNPIIHWDTRKIVFSSQFCSTNCLTYSPIVNASSENVDYKCTKADSIKATSSYDIKVVSAASFSKLVADGEIAYTLNKPTPDPQLVINTCAATDLAPCLTVNVPTKYSEYLDVFSEANASSLPDHGPADHQIPLSDGSHPPFGPIYPLSQDELKALSEYLKENLANGFIRRSSSPAAAPILFVKKKDGSLHILSH